MATLLPEGRRLLGLWPGVPVLLGSLSWLGQSLPPGWLSRGHIPCGRCQTLQPPGCSSVPSRGWGPDQPRHEGPLRPQPHGAGTGLGQRPCRCPPVSARSLCTGHTPLPRCPSPPQGSPPSPVPPPVPLCALPVPGPGDPGQQLLSLSQPRCPPLLLLPLSAGGALGTESAPAAPPPWCELGGSAWGDPRRAPWGHCGPAAARDPPAPPGLTPPSSASPPTRLVFKVQHFISVQSSLYSPRSLYQTGCAGVTRRFCNLPEQL